MNMFSQLGQKQRVARDRKVRINVPKEDLLAYLRGFFSENDQLPPYEAIAEKFGLGSVNVALRRMHSLEDGGFIERNAVGKWRFARGVGKADAQCDGCKHKLEG